MKDKLLLLLLALIVLVVVVFRIDRNVIDIKEYIVRDYSIESDLSSGLFEKVENQRKDTKLPAKEIHSALEKSPKSQASSKGPVKVLLITAHRSGSTFLGELFNENPDAFYLFEPLAGIQGEHSTLGCAKNPTKKLSLLRRYFECDTPSFYQSVPVLDAASKKLKLDKNRIIHGGKVKSRTSEMPSNAIEMEMPEHGRCARTNLCFRENHNWSCDTGICKVPQDKQSLDKLTGKKDGRCSCTPLDTSLMNKMCRNKKIIAQKVIRLCDIDHIAQLAADQPELKVVLFFRDPRGIYGSRRKLVGSRVLKPSINMTCTYYEKALDFAASHQANFIALRYEDMSLEPLETARKIYDFIGEALPASLEKWINASKASSDPGAQPKKYNNPYSTQRNSTYTATKWRFENSFAAVDYVQKTCQSMMQKAGYNFIRDEKQLTDKTFPVFAKFPLG